MPRVHAPELEDFDWFPRALRDCLTDVLRVTTTTLRIFEGAVPVLRELLEETGATRIVDLCSGGGGPLGSVLDSLEREHGLTPEVVLTDRFPNLEAFARAEARRPGQVRGERDPIDATRLPPELTGVRTLFNALHHFRPPLARAIFEDAVRSRQPIASFEIVERTPSGALMVASIPFVTLALTPALRPATLTRLAATYALPVVPAITMWDGLASCLRAYAPEELLALVEGLDGNGYRFRVDRRRAPRLPLYVTSLVGVPTD
jgi:hypothetical protein